MDRLSPPYPVGQEDVNVKIIITNDRRDKKEKNPHSTNFIKIASLQNLSCPFSFLMFICKKVSFFVSHTENSTTFSVYIDTVIEFSSVEKKIGKKEK